LICESEATVTMGKGGGLKEKGDKSNIPPGKRDIPEATYFRIVAM